MGDVEDIGVHMVSQGLKYFAINVFYVIISAIGSIVIARLLGPANYGLYSLSLVIPSILVLFSSIGIGSGLIKYVSSYIANKDYSTAKNFYLSAFLFRAFLGVVMAIFIFFFSDYLAATILNRPEISFYVKILSIVVVFQAIFTVISNFLIGCGFPGKTSFLNFLNSIIKFPIAITLIIFGFGVLGAIIGYLSGFIFSSTIGIIYVFYFLHKRVRNPNISSISLSSALKTMISYGFIIYLATLLISLSNQYINIVLAWFTSNTEIGGYNVSINLTNAITIFLTPISVVLFPSFSMIEAKDSSVLPQAFLRAIKYSVLFVAPVAMFTSTYSSYLMRIIYGSRYLFASKYLMFLALMYLIQPLLLVIISYFNGVGLNVETLKTYVIYFLTILVLTPILTMHLKVIGAIFSLILASLLSTIRGLRKCTSMKLDVSFKYLIKLYVAITISGVIASIPKNILMQPKTFLGAFITLVIGGLIYLVTLLIILTILDIPSENDISFMRKYFGRIKLINPILSILLQLIKILRKHLRRY